MRGRNGRTLAYEVVVVEYGLSRFRCDGCVEPEGQARLAACSRVSVERALGSNLVDCLGHADEEIACLLQLAVMNGVKQLSCFRLDDRLARPISNTIALILFDTFLRG